MDRSAEFDELRRMLTERRRGLLVTRESQQDELRALVSTYSPLAPGAAIPLTFRIADVRTGRSASAVDHFRGP